MGEIAVPFRLRIERRSSQEADSIAAYRRGTITVGARRELRMALQNREDNPPSPPDRSSSTRVSARRRSSHLSSIFSSRRKSRVSPSPDSRRGSSWSVRKSGYSYRSSSYRHEEDEEHAGSNAPSADATDAGEAPADADEGSPGEEQGSSIAPMQPISSAKAARMSLFQRAPSMSSLGRMSSTRFSIRKSQAVAEDTSTEKAAQWNGMKVGALVSIFTKRLRTRQREKVKTEMRKSKKYEKLIQTLWEAAIFEQKTKGTWTLKGYMDYHLSLYFYLNESMQHQ